MKNCNGCKQELDDSVFVKCDAFNDGQSIVQTYFKLCDGCRAKGRAANNRRKDKKSDQAKEHYQEYKDTIKQRNKKYRESNKARLQAYDKSPARKEFHKQWVKRKRQEDPCRFIFYSAKQRSKKSNIIFDIVQKDVNDIYPIDGKCPILGITLVINVGKTKDNSPSLDRIIPDKGYIKENIVVISHKANRIKNNATLDELKKLVSFLEEKSCQ